MAKSSKDNNIKYGEESKDTKDVKKVGHRSADLLEGREEEIPGEERKRQEGEVSKSYVGPRTGAIQCIGYLLSPC